MKKLTLAVVLSAAMIGSTAWAGGIQIDTTGTGSVGGSAFLTGLGNTTGDILFSDTTAPGNTGIMWGHNVIDLTSTIGGELTFVFGNFVDSLPGFVAGSVDYVDSAAVGTGYNVDSFFSLYWDPDPDGTGTRADHATGTGYDDGIFLAGGTVDINPTQGANLLQTSPGAVGPLSPGFGNAASLLSTARMSGNATLDIEFIDALTNTDYVVNDLTVATIDLFISDTLAAPYIVAAASDHVGADSASGNVGDTILGETGTGTNDSSCIAAAPGVGTCSVQVQANATLEFSATRIPEPATLALLGAGLGLLGFRGRRA